jgi:hypothetical protein
MRLNISPYIGAGPLRLGMTREQVRIAMSSAVREFSKSFTSHCKTDDFQDWNLHVFYKDEYVCNAIELFRGSNPFLHGISLLSTNYSSLLAEFRRRDPDLEIDASGLISRKLGVSLYAPQLEAPPESVMVFERGYYD